MFCQAFLFERLLFKTFHSFSSQEFGCVILFDDGWKGKNQYQSLFRAILTALLAFDFLFYTSLSIVHNSFWIVCYYPLCICGFFFILFDIIAWISASIVHCVWLSLLNRCHLNIHSVVTNRFVLPMKMRPNTIFVRW